MSGFTFNNGDFYIGKTNSVAVQKKKVKSIFMTLLDVNCAQKVGWKPFEKGFVLVRGATTRQESKVIENPKDLETNTKRI